MPTGQAARGWRWGVGARDLEIDQRLGCHAGALIVQSHAGLQPGQASPMRRSCTELAEVMIHVPVGPSTEFGRRKFSEDGMEQRF